MLRLLILLIEQSRPQLLPVSMSVPLAGAVIADYQDTGITTLFLLLIGANAHLAGFIINDIIDYRLDRHVQVRRQSPLIRGEISIRTASIFALSQFPITIFFYIFILHGSIIGLLVLISSIGSSLVYNRWSKWGKLPRIFAELTLALSIGLLCLSGVLVVESVTTPNRLIYCLAIGLVLLFVNSIPSGIKDIATDADFGATSFVLSTGSYVTTGGQLVLNYKLIIYAIILQMIIVAITLRLLLVFEVNSVVIFFIAVLLTYACLHLRQILTASTLKQFIHNIPFLGGFYNYFAVLLIVWSGLPSLLKIVYGSILVYMLTLPLQRAFSMWRKRFDSMIEK